MNSSLRAARIALAVPVRRLATTTAIAAAVVGLGVVDAASASGHGGLSHVARAAATAGRPAWPTSAARTGYGRNGGTPAFGRNPIATGRPGRGGGTGTGIGTGRPGRGGTGTGTATWGGTGRPGGRGGTGNGGSGGTGGTGTPGSGGTGTPGSGGTGTTGVGSTGTGIFGGNPGRGCRPACVPWGGGATSPPTATSTAGSGTSGTAAAAGATTSPAAGSTGTSATTTSPATGTAKATPRRSSHRASRSQRRPARSHRPAAHGGGRATLPATGGALGDDRAVSALTRATSGVAVAGAPARGGDADTPGAVDRRRSGRPVTSARLASASTPTLVLSRFLHVIPPLMWLTLAVALGLAVLAGAAAARSTFRQRRQLSVLAALEDAAVTDPLTGVLNRRGFLEAAERELARARRYGRRFVIAYIDIRGMKRVNDNFGHSAGDELLRHSARMLADSARAGDVVARLGGDEFGLLLAEQGPEGAEAVSRRIHDSLPTHRAEVAGDVPWELTIGSAAFPEDGEQIDALMRTADERLYERRGIALR